MSKDLVNVTTRELRKCVSEITDMLYDECEWYQKWYLEVESEEERNLDDKIFKILNERINENKRNVTGRNNP